MKQSLITNNQNSSNELTKDGKEVIEILDKVLELTLDLKQKMLGEMSPNNDPSNIKASGIDGNNKSLPNRFNGA